MINTQTLLLAAFVAVAPVLTAFSATPALADTSTPMPTKQTMAMLHDRSCTTKTVQTLELDNSIIDAVRGPVVHPVSETRTTCARVPAMSHTSSMAHMAGMPNVAASQPASAEAK